MPKTMIRSTLVGLAVAAVLLGAGSAACISEPRAEFLLGGIQVNEADHSNWFRALRDAGMNTVSATVYAKQGDWDSDNLWWEEDEPAVVAELRGAKAAGLATVLIPRIALDHAFPRNRFLWHGMIAPGDDELLERWFSRYREFVLKWARVARDEGVDLFAVGSELNSMASTEPVDELPGLLRFYLDEQSQHRRRELILRELSGVEQELTEESAAHRAWAERLVGPGEAAAGLARLNRRRERLGRHWERLIGEVRQVYPGPLTFAANFDQYKEVGFWPLLDRIGINAYFPLREDAPAASGLYGELVKGWTEVLNEIGGYRRDRGLGKTPVVFTELGYTARAGTTLAPWSGSGFALLWTEDRARALVWDRQPDDFEERALAVRALHEALSARDDDLLRGLLYWKLTTRTAHREIEPFVHVLGAPDDPLGRELRRFKKGTSP